MKSPSQPSIAVYGTVTCSDCARSKRWLTDHGLVYSWFDIASDHALAQFVFAANEQLGIAKLTQIPIVVIGDQLLSEPTDADLERALLHAQSALTSRTPPV